MKGVLPEIGAGEGPRAPAAPGPWPHDPDMCRRASLPPGNYGVSEELHRGEDTHPKSLPGKLRQPWSFGLALKLCPQALNLVSPQEDKPWTGHRCFDWRVVEKGNPSPAQLPKHPKGQDPTPGSRAPLQKEKNPWKKKLLWGRNHQECSHHPRRSIPRQREANGHSENTCRGPGARHRGGFAQVPLAQAALVVKNSPASSGDTRDRGSTPGSGRSPGEGHATHSTFLAWRIWWTEGCKESDSDLAHRTLMVQSRGVLRTRWLSLIPPPSASISHETGILNTTHTHAHP